MIRPAIWGAAVLALVTLVGGLWAWHARAVAVAVAGARAGLTTAFEAESLRAEVDFLRAASRSQIAAAGALADQVQAARAEARAAAEELERYAHETTIDPVCTVGADLVRRLRAN